MSGTDKRGKREKQINLSVPERVVREAHSMHDTNLFSPCRMWMTQRKETLQTLLVL